MSAPDRPARRARSAVAAIGLAALSLAACGGDDPTREAATGSTLAGEPATGSALGNEEFGLSTEELATRIEQIEAAIAPCMNEAGFDYVPVDFQTVYDAMSSSGSLPGVSDEDYVAQYGFGITTTFGLPDPTTVNGRGEQNAAIRDALAPADQVAYDRSLFGGDASVSLARALEDEDFSATGGCVRQSAEQHFTDDELNGSYENPTDLLINTDPRMVAATGDWSACVADQGYDYPSIDELEGDLADQLAAIVGTTTDPAALTADATAALADLQGFERAVAQIAEDCADETTNGVEETIEEELFGNTQN